MTRHVPTRSPYTISNFSFFFSDSLLQNTSSFLYGRNPQLYSVPVYALIDVCHLNQRKSYKSYPKTPLSLYQELNFNGKSDNNTLDNTISTFGEKSTKYPNFHVTYWMFYPFSQGKALCTFDMGRFGAWPIPKVNNYCLGNIKEFGNHVGDWEHMSLYFEVSILIFFLFRGRIFLCQFSKAEVL